jgi:hypothetical protein
MDLAASGGLDRGLLGRVTATIMRDDGILDGQVTNAESEER